jgi:hypothetical protein
MTRDRGEEGPQELEIVVDENKARGREWNAVTLGRSKQREEERLVFA